MYARMLPRLHHPLRGPAAQPLGARAPLSRPLAGQRVRLTAGALEGLTGEVLDSSDPARWMIEIDDCKLLVRVHPAALECLPK